VLELVGHVVPAIAVAERMGWQVVIDVVSSPTAVLTLLGCSKIRSEVLECLCWAISVKKTVSFALS
jgi:hypothetical protein